MKKVKVRKGEKEKRKKIRKEEKFRHFGLNDGYNYTFGKIYTPDS